VLLVSLTTGVHIHASPVTALTFSPEGETLVAAGDGRLEVRSPISAAVQRRIELDLPKITSLAFALHGRRLVVGGGEPGVRGEWRLLDWPAATPRPATNGHPDLVTHVAIDSTGARLGVASMDHTACVWSLGEHSAPRLEFTLNGHTAPVLAIAFSPAGDTLVTAGADRALKMWSAADGRLLRSLSQHTETIRALAFRPRAEGDVSPVTCATAGEDRTVRIWHPGIGRMVRLIRGHAGSILALAWSPDGNSLFSGGKDGVIRRLDAASDAILAQWPVHDDWIYALAHHPATNVIASCDWSGAVRVRPWSP
jgi:WD40 repeat protein